MKCTVCGKELKDGAKFCAGCGNPVKIVPREEVSDEKQCPKCNETISSDKKFCKFCGWDTTQPYIEDVIDDEDPQGGSGSVIIKIIIVLLVLAILGVGGFFGYKYFMSDKDSEETIETTEAAKENEEDKDDGTISVNGQNDTTEAPAAEAATTAPAEATTEAPAPWKADYTDNESCDLAGNMTLDAFNRIASADGEYYFSYPTHVFNNSSYSEDGGYYFSYVDGSGNTTCYMQVYSEDAPTTDILGYMQAKQNELMGSFPSTDFSKNGSPGYGYYFPEDIPGHGIGDDGIMQVVVSGWTDSSKNMKIYICCGNDGSKTYYLKVGYPDYDSNNDDEQWDYIVMNVYRLCSFGGSTKPPFKNYEEYLK